MYLKYLWYVIRHKWFVLIECCKLGIPFRGIIHDIHKFYPNEFIAYARYFYGDYEKASSAWLQCPSYTGPTKESVKYHFDYAWNHHQKHPLGKHHWQYHVLVNDDDGTYALKMPFIDMLEMYCDWVGAGKAITGKDNTKEWYESRKDKIILHDKTRGYIENLICFRHKNFKKLFRKEYG